MEKMSLLKKEEERMVFRNKEYPVSMSKMTLEFLKD